MFRMVGLCPYHSLTEGFPTMQCSTIPCGRVEQTEWDQFSIESDDVDTATLPPLDLSGPDILECHRRNGKVMSLCSIDECSPGSIVLITGRILSIHGILDVPPKLRDLLPGLVSDLIRALWWSKCHSSEREERTVSEYD